MINPAYNMVERIQSQGMGQEGYRMLMSVSHKCPNSITAQSALIALECREKKFDPQMLRHALLSDANLVEQAADGATRAHEKLGIPIKITPEKARQIIADDFGQAESMLLLKDEELHHVSDVLYPQFFSEGGNNLLTEIEFGRTVSLMIMKKRPGR